MTDKVTAKTPTASEVSATAAVSGSVRTASRVVSPDREGEGESPWTQAELRQVRADLVGEADRLSREISAVEAEPAGVVEGPGGADGRDEADVGGRLAERERELNALEGARAGLEQSLSALKRLDEGTYGVCESCGQPIGKLRLQVFQRATSCVTCKKAQERG